MSGDALWPSLGAPMEVAWNVSASLRFMNRSNVVTTSNIKWNQNNM